MAKRKRLGNARQLKGQNPNGKTNQVELRYIVTCIMNDKPEEFNQHYFSAEKEESLSDFDPTAHGYTMEEWQAFCMEAATFESMVVTIYRAGGDITVGETVLTIGKARYRIMGEEYRSFAQLKIPTLQRVLQLVRVPNLQ